MAVKLNLKKDELIQVADELGLAIPDNVKVVQLKNLIESSDVYKNNSEFVRDLIDNILEERKEKLDKEKLARENEKLARETEIQLETLKLAQLEKQLEIANVKKNLTDTSLTTEVMVPTPSTDNLERLISSVKTLTIPVPVNSESFNLFFHSLEKAFKTKFVPNELKAEILLNILGERVNNLLVYVNQEDLVDYEKIKGLVMREFEPTPQKCWNNFKKAQKLPSETYVQFASRLSASFNYYCQLRKVTEFKSLCELIVSDKICETLDRELMTHIGVKQGETFFTPQQLGRECDMYLTSRGNYKNEVSSRNVGEPNGSRGYKWQKNSNWRADRNVSKVFVSEEKGVACVLCKNAFHPLYTCPKFKKLSVWERADEVKKNKLCFRCFLPHKLRECHSKRNCFCGQPHNMMIHFPREDNSISGRPGSQANAPLQQSARGGEAEVVSQPQIVATSFEKSKRKNVLLSTVRALVKNKYSEWIEVRCLLDVGSQSCLCTRACAERLQLKLEKINTVVSCVNDATMVVNACVRTSVANKDKSYERELSLLVVNKITDLIPSRIMDVWIDGSEFVSLADYSFNVPGQIDMLLGAEIFYELLRPGQIYAQNSQLLLQNTVFGYVASGSVDQVQNDRVHCGLILDDDLNKTLKQFWEIENVGMEQSENTEASLSEDHFVRTHMRNEEGRYVVSMPMSKDPSCLGNSKDIAVRRLNSLWKRLSRDSEYLLLYTDFLREYEELGHMEKVVESSEPPIHYYIPHHGVLRPDKLTTKLRVVFNASSPTTTGVSLNDVLMKGQVTEDVFGTITRFRRHRFAFTTDIQKMYRQILIDPDQRDLQRIVWKTGDNEEILTYRLKTVTYGTSSAPFLAIRTLQQLAKDEESRFPLASEALLHDTYMDDIVTGAPDLETARALQSQLRDALQSCGMTLHKWSSNSPDLLNSSLSCDVEHPFTADTEFSVKTLGISWKPVQDQFVFKVSISNRPSYTKREVLSVIARLYDPLGFLGPVITRAKILLQRLWQQNLDWDDMLPDPIAEEWSEFVTTLKRIENVKVERYILIDGCLRIVLQGFADASEAAYGAVVYLQCFSRTDVARTTILASKSRVAPIRVISIPRLELCACLLLAQLVEKVRATLRLESDVVLHTDSTIALAWLNTPSNRLKTFIANRVSKVQQLTENCQWNHVPSALNPADVISRGLGPRDLPELELWWKGPPFLQRGETSCRQPSPTLMNDSEYSCELKPSLEPDMTLCNVMSTSSELSLLSDLVCKSNNYVTVLRVFSYVLRFINNVKQCNVKLSGPLGTSELDKAEKCLIRMVQEEVFSAEIRNLQKQKNVLPNSKLRNLNPFLDSNGIVRVGGRLGNSDLPYDSKYPAILPNNHKVTNQIVMYFHKKNLHVGASTLLHCVREKFWPLNGRSLCRKIVHTCIICFKMKPNVTSQLMGSLPRDRVVPDYPFNCSGVDFCGPFFVRYRNQRKGILHKLYICIFVCFVTKAVHVEIVSDLTSEAFIATLKRFFGRRGKCAKLYSDNGKNFVGANQIIKRLLKLVKNPDEQLAGFLSAEGVEWKFIPPRAPSFGGLWEAAIKSVKYHFKRVVSGAHLTYEEFLTVSVQIEGVLNSRPLCPLSNNEDDFGALTPAHFLIGRSINSIVEPDLTKLNENALKRWQRVTRLVQLIWSKWHRNYLSELQQRNKWRFQKNNVRIGDLVVLVEDNMPTFKWPLGRIIELYYGNDNLVRVVKVRTQYGVYKRAISRVCILPMPD